MLLSQKMKKGVHRWRGSSATSPRLVEGPLHDVQCCDLRFRVEDAAADAGPVFVFVLDDATAMNQFLNNIYSLINMTGERCTYLRRRSSPWAT